MVPRRLLRQVPSTLRIYYTHTRRLGGEGGVGWGNPKPRPQPSHSPPPLIPPFLGRGNRNNSLKQCNSEFNADLGSFLLLQRFQKYQIWFLYPQGQTTIQRKGRLSGKVALTVVALSFAWSLVALITNCCKLSSTIFLI